MGNTDDCLTVEPGDGKLISGLKTECDIWSHDKSTIATSYDRE